MTVQRNPVLAFASGLMPLLVGMALTVVMMITVPTLWKNSEVSTAVVEDRNQLANLVIQHSAAIIAGLEATKETANGQASETFLKAAAGFQQSARTALENKELRQLMPDRGARLVLATEELQRQLDARNSDRVLGLLSGLGTDLSAYLGEVAQRNLEIASESAHRISQMVRIIILASGALLSISLLAMASFLQSSRIARRQSSLLANTVAELAEAQRISRMGTIRWDFVTNEVKCSNQMSEIFGIAPDAILRGHDFTALIHPDDMERVVSSEKKALARSAQTGHPEVREIGYRARRPDGKVIDLWARSELTAASDGTPLSMLSTVRDITTEENRRRTLAESERSLSLSQRISRLGLFRHMYREKRDWWSNEMYELLGYPKDGGPIALSALVVDEDQEVVSAALSRVSEMAEPKSERTTTLKFRMCHRNGDVRHFRCAAAMTFDANGEPEELTGTLIDITDQVRQGEQLEEALREARRANNAKSDFLAIMSHELRTPLNGILGMLGALSEAKLPQAQKDHLRVARTSANALLEILNDILDMSKIEAGKLETERAPFSVRDLVASVRQLYSVRIEEKGLALVAKVDEAVPEWVSADAPRIRQILSNLISNAIKFTPAGSVTLSVKAKRAEDGGLHLQFSVIDTGIGIALDKQKHVFERFNQLDLSYNRRFGGTGLGLSICRSLTDIMGGELTFHSIPGYGTTFTLSLPCSEVNAPADAEDTRQVLSLPLPRRRVLVVEDNAINQVVAQHALTRLEQDVDVAKDGLEAIEAALRTDYDLILADLSMPRMDGYQMLAHLRGLGGRFKALPIVALTGHVGDAEIAACKTAGFDAVLGKPLQTDDLRKVLANLGAVSAALPLPLVEEATVGGATWGTPESLDAEFDLGISRLIDTLGEDMVEPLLDAALSDIARYQVSFDRFHRGDRSDPDELRRTIHSIVGLARNLSCKTLASQASELERAVAANLPQPTVINGLEAILQHLVLKIGEAKGHLRRVETALRRAQ